MRRLGFTLALAYLFASAHAVLGQTTPGQTTGTLIGRVIDESGGVLPGTTIEVKSSALQGTQSTITGRDGSYRIPLLPPGSYSVTAKLAGFQNSEQTVVVQLDRTATADFRLRAMLKQEIVVTGEVPVVDTTSTTSGSNFNDRDIRTLPTGRNYTSVVLVSPGVTAQVSNTSTFSNTIAVYGSSGLENSYIIDGTDTSGVEYGAQGKELNFEFIQEVDVKTAGYQAEYGRSTGGIINVITKSGGNDFHGDGFGYYTSDSLQANNKHPNENLFGTNQGFTQYDYGVDLGGFILKDRLWFFGAYDRVKNTTTNEITAPPNGGALVKSPSLRNLGAGKITWRISPSHSFIASFLMDPRVDTGAINDGAHTLNGDFSTFLGRQDFGGRDYAGRYYGLFGSSWVATAQFARHQERNSVSPATAAGEGIEYIDSRNNNIQSGGFGLVQDKSFKRYFGGGSITKYLGNHEFKVGLEYETQDATVTKMMSGGQQVKLLDNSADPANPIIYRHFYWTIPTASLPDNVPTSQLSAVPKHKMISAYFQDSWKILPNLTLNAGLRWDEQKIYDSIGVKQIDLNDEFAPRLGLIWDPSKDHRTKVYGSFGFFYEQIPMDLVIRSYSYERQPVIYNFDPVSIVPNDVAAALAADKNNIKGGFTEPADPNIKGQYLREFLFGVEREVIPNLAVGVKYVYRNYQRTIEDFVCDSSADYCIGNPGKGIMSNLFSLDYVDGLPAPKPQRIFRGVQLDVTKRFSDNWSLVASYLWSKLQGNYDGGFAPYTQPFGTADPNISAAYDYYDFFTKGPVPCTSTDADGNCLTNGPPFPYTATGYLSNDRRHQIKLYGTYVTPFNLSVGFAAYFRTGTPVSRLGYSVAYDRWEFFLTQRGTDGRVPSDYEVDLHFGYPLQLGPVTVTALVDIFQLLNVQRATFLDERYNTAQFLDPNHVCGTSGPDEVNCNAFYKTALSRTSPREVRFGLRIGF
jgi:outer membrane receptor for ferrienterochelin and colicin